jgi:UDP-N-acetylglucosamine--N-acetylmuramyl-(pentapeptide) pyrophosphoryl-undecaprenol N-acetylglucosamine transferase
VYPALAVLEQLNAEFSDVDALWVGAEGGMEAGLVSQAGMEFETIPAAGVHGVGLITLPGNLFKLLSGFFAARRIIRRFQPDMMFFTGGYVAVPMALAGLSIPTALFVPDIEPGLALKTLTRFANRIAVSTQDSLAYFKGNLGVRVMGYPVREDLLNWDREAAYKALQLQADLPTLLVFGGSKGARSINRALFRALPNLLPDMQIIHISGTLNWSEVENAEQTLSELDPHLAERYHPHPYLHAEMGAAFRAADLVLSRAGASCLGEFPIFGLPAILVPYPHAWRYQKGNAEFMVRNKAAILMNDADLEEMITPIVSDLINDEHRRGEMSAAMKSLAQPGAASSIAKMLHELAQVGKQQGIAS